VFILTAKAKLSRGDFGRHGRRCAVHLDGRGLSADLPGGLIVRGEAQTAHAINQLLTSQNSHADWARKEELRRFAVLVEERGGRILSTVRATSGNLANRVYFCKRGPDVWPPCPPFAGSGLKSQRSAKVLSLTAVFLASDGRG